MGKILEIAGVSRKFGLLKAVDDASFSIDKGEIFGLVGESGCGKSTLARIILRLITADRGSIVFNGHDISRAGSGGLRGLRSKLQIVFQDPAAALDPKMTVGEAVMEPLKIKRPKAGGRKTEAGGQRPEEKAVRLLGDVGLNDKYMNRYPHEISGGECQRVCIARALALDPAFIVLDEPVSSLDCSVQEKIVDLLLSIKNENDLTYLFITHDLVLARKLCNRIAVMKDGRIIETGPTEAIFGSPVNDYTKQLIGDSI